MSVLNFLMRGNSIDSNYEIGRLLWAASVVAGIGYTGADLFVNARFDITQFGIGMGTLMALGGGGIAAKDMANKASTAAGTTTETRTTTTEVAPEGT